jgi:uncharacterized YccA/Bax inhibitor family protein
VALFKSGNPALKQETFAGLSVAGGEEVMTLQGTVNKTGLLLTLIIVAAFYTWNIYFSTNDPASIVGYLLVGTIGGLIVGVVTAFKKTWAPVLAPAYAVLQGLALGGISAIFEAEMPGIVLEAMTLTFGIFAVLLVLYKTEVIKASENFKLIVASATGGIALYYLVSMFGGMFGFQLPLIHDNTTGGIIFSLFVVAIASMNLVVDFDFIEQGAEQRCPKYMEWYGAFGLMVTLVWLYLEILRLLAKSRRR